MMTCQLKEQPWLKSCDLRPPKHSGRIKSPEFSTFSGCRI